MQKKRNKKVTVSSPNLGANKESNLRNTDIGLSSSIKSMNEQIIGLEFVTVIGSCYNYKDSNKNGRKRTTTLTCNNNYDENSNKKNSVKEQEINKIEESKDNFLCYSSFDKKIVSEQSTNDAVFYSKFSKFNKTCLLDLIEDKDKDEFKKLIKGFKSESEICSSDSKFSILKNIKIYLRFNWYSFDDISFTTSNALYSSKNANFLNSSKLLNINHNQIFNKQPDFCSINDNVDSINLPYNNQQLNISDTKRLKNLTISNRMRLSQEFILQNNTNINDNAASNNSTETLYSSNLQLNKRLKLCSKFEYFHLLYPKINEFKWHLKDEIFSNQDIEFKNMRLLKALMMHIKEGVKRNFTHCHYDTKKIILNKTTITYTTTIIDPKPMTNAARIHSSKTTTTKSIEEDKTILSVDSNKFFSEFLQIIKTLENSFYNCKLQQINDSFCLNCNYQDLLMDKTKNSLFSFKILLSLQKQTKNNNQDDIKKVKLSENDSISPTIMSSYQKIQNENKTINAVNNKREKPLSHLSNQTTEHVNSYSSNSQIISQQKSFQRQVPHKQQTHIKQEVIINQIKVKVYFGFNNSYVENHDQFIKKLVEEFNNKIDELIKLVYLKLSLKEIHDSRKWNNLLYLSDNISQIEKTNYSILKTDEEYKNEKNSINESKIKIKNQKGKLSCNCVWSVTFKLHRLHQIMQKV
jgi:hypothetical protein